MTTRQQRRAGDREQRSLAEAKVRVARRRSRRVDLAVKVLSREGKPKPLTTS